MSVSVDTFKILPQKTFRIGIQAPFLRLPYLKTSSLLYAIAAA